VWKVVGRRPAHYDKGYASLRETDSSCSVYSIALRSNAAKDRS